MSSPAEVKPPPPIPRLLWWIIWAAILGGATVVYLFLGHAPRRSPPTVAAYIGLAPLALSAIVRWLVFPRFRDLRRAFAPFIVGVTLAEGCTMLGTFLGGEHRDAVAVLGLLGVVQWMPTFLSRLSDAPVPPPPSLR